MVLPILCLCLRPTGLHFRMYTLVHRLVEIRWPQLPLFLLRLLPVDRLWSHFVLEGSLLRVSVIFSGDGCCDTFIIDTGVFDRCKIRDGILYCGFSTTGVFLSPRGQLGGRPGRWWLRTPGSATPRTLESLPRRNLVLVVLYPSSATYLS